MSSSYAGTGVTANPNNAGTGGSVLKYGAMFSQSIWHYTDNVGYPTSNEWQDGLDGSFFNRYDANTDTAEILRFIAGLLSASAPDVSENINTWSSTEIDFSAGGTTSKSSYMSGVLGGATYRNAKLSNNYNSSTRIDFTKTGSYRRVQNYLITKGFIVSSETSSNTLHDVGTNPFGKNVSNNDYGNNFPSTIYNTFSTFTYNADSVAAGSSTVTSSISQSPNKTFGMGGLINSTTVTPYSMSMVGTQSFGNNTGSTVPDESSTFTTSSNNIFIISSENTSGDSNGLYLGILDSGNPQIANQFQDGKFLNSPGAISGRKWSASDSDATTGATTASIGYYRLHDLKVGLKTGSQSSFGYNTVDTPNTSVGFYAPTLATLGVQNITQNDPTPTVNRNVVRTAFTATSRSLSGAPYLLTATYEYDFSTDASLCFDPCYAYSTAPLATSLTSDGWNTIGTTTLSNTSISVTSAGIQTSTVNGGVYPNGGTPATRRSTNDIPHYNDEAFLSSSFTFTLDSNATGATTASIGYYRLHDLKVGLKTGSQSSFGYNTVDTPNTSVGFYAPTLATLGVQNITQNDPTPTVNRNVVRTAFTATSRSLSGAPYLLTATYEYDFSTDASLCFDPCYAYSTAPLATSLTSDGWNTIGTTTLSNTSISVTSAGIQTSTVNGGVYPNGGTPATRRSTNDIPHYNDEAFLSSSFTFTLDSNASNVVQSKSTMFSRQYTIQFRTTARNWKNSATNSDSSAENFWDNTLFNQLAA